MFFLDTDTALDTAPTPIPDGKLLKPRRPGKKPVGNVELSRGVAAHTVGYWLLRPQEFKELSSRYSNSNAAASWDGDIAVFNGTSDHIRVDDDDRLDGMDQLTICARVRVDVSTLDQLTIVAKHHDTSSLRTYYMGIQNGVVRCGLATSSSGIMVYTDGTTTLEVGRFYDITFVYNGSERILYVDGVEEGSASQSGIIKSNSNDLTIGARYKASIDQWWDGLSLSFI